MRIAVVQQRYGRDLLGGAETHGALMARLLARRHDVEIVTTTAGDYQTWTPAWEPGVEDEDGVRIRRFPVTRGRADHWPQVNEILHDGFRQEEFAELSADARAAFLRRIRSWPDGIQEEFIRGQGPIAPGIPAWLREANHDAVLFLTYLYPTTYDGLMAVDPARASLVPTLHDEPAAYLPVFAQRLARARLLCSTQTEIELLDRLHPEAGLTATRLGYGIELPEDRSEPAAPDAPLLYAGRVDPQKGIPELLRWYAGLRELLADPPELVLIGEVLMDLPSIPGLRALGFVSEEEKESQMRNALAFVHPSPFESLGIVILEALACRTPVLVTARSDVMREHCERSGAGLPIRDAADLAAAVRLLRAPDRRATLGARGRAWVEAEYGMEAYAERLLRAFPG